MMAITPLPQSTVYLLGSAQALTTPTSLVKELVDNALDAKALSIDILISSNTIDKIEVRDNGHGIQEADFDAIGRRGYTSKLRSFDELKSIGGVSLGFRGEALASAVQLGEVSITTRCEGDNVATLLKLKTSGGVDSQSRTSHPIGTTVSVTKFMYKLPVRKQTFMKEASKTLVKIKELLQAYALARPNIKFSLKVLKDNKSSWSYAPRPKVGIKEAVSQVIGKEAASQCFSKSTSFPEWSNGDERTVEHGSISTDGNVPGQATGAFVVDVFLPKPDADPAKIGHGQFLSVDSRPVSHEKGTMRKIVTIFKYYVKASLQEGFEKMKSPFLRLNITCPVGSYDPNVEPAKNDVLFGNESVVLEAIENMFRKVYGEPKTAASVPPAPLMEEKLDNFELFLARKPSAIPAVDPPSPAASETMTGLALESVSSNTQAMASPAMHGLFLGGESHIVDKEETDEPVDTSKRKWAFDMSKDLSEDVETTRSPRQSRPFQSSQIPDSEAGSSARNDLNPWLIAKMTAPIQQRAQLRNTTGRQLHPASRHPAAIVPTPQHSSDPFTLEPEVQVPDPSRPRQTFHNHDIRSLEVDQPAHNLPYHHPEGAIVQQRIFQANGMSLTTDEDDELLLGGDDSGIRRRRNDFVSARIVTNAALLSPPATLAPKKYKGVNKPFVTPMRRNEKSSSHDGMHQTRLFTDHGGSPVQNHMNQTSLEEQPSSDLEWSMDFEHRKGLATKRRRQELRAAALESDDSETRREPRNSPHKNRYNAAIANLENDYESTSQLQAIKEPFKTSLPDSDPRAYLMRRQKSVIAQKPRPGEPPKLMRAKSNRLPLENIPDSAKTHNLVLGVVTDVNHLRTIAAAVMKSDVYVKNGLEHVGLRIDGLVMSILASRVEVAVGKWMRTPGNENCVVEYNYENLANNEEL